MPGKRLTLKPDQWMNTVVYSVLTILFIGGLILTVFEIDLYRNTLIRWIVPTGIWLATGAIMTPVTSALLTTHYGTKGLFLKFVYNLGAFGGIVVYVFMALNFYGASEREKTVSGHIIGTGTLSKSKGCGQPFARVQVKRQIKELVFPCGFEFGSRTVVNLTLREGLFGFDIIEDRELVR